VSEPERARLREAGPDKAFDPDFLAKIFRIKPASVHGPFAIGIADRNCFKPARSHVRLLDEEDLPAVGKLLNRCGELDHWRFVPHRRPKSLFGRFQGDELVALSWYEVREGLLAMLRTLTHPEHRGKGHGTAVSSAAAADAISRGFVAVWQELEANGSALAIGKSLGFHPYGSMRVADFDTF
jgi:GNAT superfamily N-acetyltransferase